MDIRYRMREHLFLSTLTIHYTKRSESHHFDCRVRKVQNSLAYIAKGSVEFTIMNEKVYAKEGDLIFVPEGVRYVSHWSGSPDICFYNVHFSLSKKSASLWKSMKLQCIQGAPNEEARKLIDNMYSSAQEGDLGQIRTFQFFYQLLFLLLPHMETNSTQNLPEPLQKAIEFIETNYATVTTVHEIATACFLSESRLYHLFKEHLNLSPISYLNHVRVHAAIELLSNPDLSIQQIASQLNFHSEYYFRKTFQKITGTLPSKMRKML